MSAKNELKRWMTQATPKEVERMAALAKTTKGNLRSIAGGYRTNGEARTYPEAARLIEIATARMRREGLEPVYREQLCAACAKCEYVKAK